MLGLIPCLRQIICGGGNAVGTWFVVCVLAPLSHRHIFLQGVGGFSTGRTNVLKRTVTLGATTVSLVSSYVIFLAFSLGYTSSHAQRYLPTFVLSVRVPLKRMVPELVPIPVFYRGPGIGKLIVTCPSGTHRVLGMCCPIRQLLVVASPTFS